MDYMIETYDVDTSSSVGTVVLEDCIMQKDKKTEAGSKILAGFTSLFDAEVVTRLKNAGYVVVGRAQMQEFGIAPLWNPTADADPAHNSACSRTVSGAVSAVAEGQADFALCNDFSGIHRKAAAQCGLAYLHPTYGTVSRYGVIPMIASMDQVGVVCKDPAAGYRLLAAIRGADAKDGAMFPETPAAATPERPVIGISNALTVGSCDTVPVDLPYMDVCKQVMYILGAAEISNNINRYDGIKFGYRTENYKNLNELYLKSRSEGFGDAVKLTAIMGSMVLSTEFYDKFYDKAMRVRRLIKESMTFEGYDVIALPVYDGKDPYEDSGYLALAPLAGLPSLTVSVGGKAVQLIGRVGGEASLVTAWEVMTR